MALIKSTTLPIPRPKPSPSTGIWSELGDEPNPDAAGGGLNSDEVELADVDVAEAEPDVIVVGVILSKKDDAMADISGSAAA